VWRWVKCGGVARVRWRGASGAVGVMWGGVVLAAWGGLVCGGVSWGGVAWRGWGIEARVAREEWRGVAWLGSVRVGWGCV